MYEVYCRQPISKKGVETYDFGTIEAFFRPIERQDIRTYNQSRGWGEYVALEIIIINPTITRVSHTENSCAQSSLTYYTAEFDIITN